MTEELEKKLSGKYPGIFPAQHNGSFYFECNDGWYGLIDSLCAVIQAHVTHKELNGVDHSESCAVQVKEKWGTLRFYVSGYDDYVYGAIAMAEMQSGVICELCGAAGTRIKKAHIQTLCVPCHEREKEHWAQLANNSNQKKSKDL